MDDAQIQIERAQNLWDRSVRKMPPLERSSEPVSYTHLTLPTN